MQAHCQSRTSQRTDQSFVKELAKPTQEKLFLKNFQTLQKKIKNATYNPTQKMQADNDTQTQHWQWFTRTDDRTPVANTRYS